LVGLDSLVPKTPIITKKKKEEKKKTKKLEEEGNVQRGDAFDDTVPHLSRGLKLSNFKPSC
jgi:hypothetical protein